MSPAVAARGKIRRAERRGESIPLGYALDAHGRPTTDPTAALGGVVLPIGGYKGSGLSMLMDIFGGVISGAAFAGDVADQYKVFDRPQDVGHFFLAMRPDLFIPESDYRDRMDTLIERVRDCPKAEGFDEILIPGEPEARHEAEQRRTGIPYSAERDRGLAGRGDQGRGCAARRVENPDRRVTDMQVDGYDIEIVIQGYPGKTVCHGGLGWSSVVLIRGRDRVALIDTGPVGYRVPLMARLKERGLTPSDVTDLLITHIHHDHCINWTLFLALAHRGRGAGTRLGGQGAVGRDAGA